MSPRRSNAAPRRAVARVDRLRRIKASGANSCRKEGPCSRRAVPTMEVTGVAIGAALHAWIAAIRITGGSDALLLPVVTAREPSENEGD